MSAFVHEWVGAGILTAAFFAIIGTAELWSRVGTPSPEATRKLVHLGSGLTCLLFPYLLTSPWTVLAMATLMTAFFRIAAYFEVLDSVHGIDRSSRGSEYYPLAIFLVFLLSGDQPWIYSASVLILGVADACAALVGSRYGELRYTVQDDEKSVEGSAVFFSIALLAIVGPGWVLGPEPVPELLFSAATAAALLTGFEAISLEGADNLFVPVAASVILEKQASDPYGLLVDQFLILLGLFAALVALNQTTRLMTPNRRSAVNTGATLASAMFAYAVWTLGGFDWAAPVLVLFVLFIISWMLVALVRRARHRIAVRTTYRALLAPLTLLIFANSFQWYDELYGPFLAACTAILAFGIWARVRGNGVPFVDRRPALAALAIGAAGSVALVAVPCVLQSTPPTGSALFVVLMTAGTAVAHARLVELHDFDPAETMWPGPSLYLTVVQAAVVLVVQSAGVLRIWNPDLWNV